MNVISSKLLCEASFLELHCIASELPICPEDIELHFIPEVSIYVAVFGDIVIGGKRHVVISVEEDPNIANMFVLTMIQAELEIDKSSDNDEDEIEWHCAAERI